jgi:tetratricopeptide (TPR) repeat protein
VRMMTESNGAEEPMATDSRSVLMTRRTWKRALLMLCASLIAGGCTMLPTRSGSGEGTTEIAMHTVSPGETLESIADDYFGTTDAAAYLAEANDLPSGSGVEPGVTLEVPVGEKDLERYRIRTEAKILYNKGTTLADAGDYAKAQEEFRAALKVDPRFVDAAYNLGVVLLSTGDAERAIAVLETALSIRPDEPLIEFALGKAHLDAGRAINAVVHFNRAVELDPTLEEARFARAVALLESGERDSAVVALDAYLRDFPDGAWAPQARAELERLAHGAAAP